MDKRLFRISYILIFIGYSLAETGEKRYEVIKKNSLVRLFFKMTKNYENLMRLKELKPMDYLPLQGSIDEDFKFKPTNFQFHVPLQNVSKCMQDISYMAENIRSEWGRKMMDSYGKPESGIYNGNFIWTGDYNECVGIRVSNSHSNETAGNFRGKYCSLTWSLKSPSLSAPFQFVSGVCIPDSCSAEILQNDALQLLHVAGVLPVWKDTKTTVHFNDLECQPTERHLNSAAIAMIALLFVFCILAVLGSSITAVKYFKKTIEESKKPSIACDHNDLVKVDENGMPDDVAHLQDDDPSTIRGWKKLESFLLCFCVFTNGAKLLNTNPSKDELVCIHGIRFLSMSWIILGHTYTLGMSQAKNMVQVLNETNTFLLQPVIQSSLAVESFFVLSGFLHTFQKMKDFSKTKGKISWLYFYIHRYLGLTPMYMVILGYWATAAYYLGSGPYWPLENYDVACSKLWWRNLLFINNFDLKSGVCFGHSWYLANDMQFYIISPIFLITLWRWPVVGYSLLSVFLWACCLCNFFITYHFDLGNGIITLMNNMDDLPSMITKYLQYNEKLYVKPYTRIAPYLIGMLTGYVLFKTKSSNATKHSLVFLTVGWIVASSTALTILFGLYHTHLDLVTRSFYNALSGACWAAALCWIIYVCVMGQGGFINSLLSVKLFIPLSRISYAAYLIHLMVIKVYFVSLRSPMEFSDMTMLTLFLGLTVVTYALCFPVTLILHSPIVALEKLLLQKFSSKRKLKNS